ncbi:MAG: hypothetical protein JWR54_438 [Mucilaginibacter sp.]|nr:hypothetical protein [Mucilaginibacter sp.]
MLSQGLQLEDLVRRNWNNMLKFNFYDHFNNAITSSFS